MWQMEAGRLAARGLVRLRPRSGVYLSSGVPGCGEDSKVGHSALWIRDLATEAWLRRIPLHELGTFVDRFLSSRVLRALCIESTRDTLVAEGDDAPVDPEYEEKVQRTLRRFRWARCHMIAGDPDGGEDVVA